MKRKNLFLAAMLLIGGLVLAVCSSNDENKYSSKKGYEANKVRQEKDKL